VFASETRKKKEEKKKNEEKEIVRLQKIRGSDEALVLVVAERSHGDGVLKAFSNQHTA
jgi:hypothetical protein